MKCPVMHLCKAYRNKTELSIPVKPPKKPRKVEEKTVLLIEKNREYAIRKRADKGLLAGLWELPSLEGKLALAAIEELFLKQGVKISKIEPLGEAKHIFTHIEWHMTGYYIRLDEANAVYEDNIYQPERENGVLWAGKSNIDDNYTLPSAFEKYRYFIQ